jgi:hypothetical protein
MGPMAYKDAIYRWSTIIIFQGICGKDDNPGKRTGGAGRIQEER